MEQRVVQAASMAVALVILLGAVAKNPSFLMPPESAGGTGPNWIFIGIIGLLAVRLLWTVIGGLATGEKGPGTGVLSLVWPNAREPQDSTAGPSSAEQAMEAAIKARHAPMAMAATADSTFRPARSATGAGTSADRGLSRPCRSGGFGRR